MSGYKRNQQSQFRNTNQDWRHDEDWRQDLNPYAGSPRGQHQPRGFRHGAREDKDFGNYRGGGYFGLTYHQEQRERRKQRMGFGQNYQRVEERDDGRGGWWEPERMDMPAHRSDEERRYGPAGVHRGKGPRNYQRSDERIREDFNDRLADDPFIDASDVEVMVRNCEVILTGTVVSRDAKRRAEDIGESVSGVKNIENRLRVKNNADWTNRDGNSEDRTVGTQRSGVTEAIR
jgi:osmotically-inducible protein OsmY